MLFYDYLNSDFIIRSLCVTAFLLSFLNMMLPYVARGWCLSLVSSSFRSKFKRLATLVSYPYLSLIISIKLFNAIQ